ncbi:MAG TPA: hypothetical protein VFX85_02620 [Solirubrobacterales bacterium]|nr:hypothetical protein [Solirubrobacterales bacterium]
MTAAGNFNFSRAVREWCFVQVPLVELGRMRDMARSRGLSDFGLHSRGPWEALDREGIFTPVAYAPHAFWPYDQQRALAEGELIIREESGHLPWQDLKAKAEETLGDDANPQVLYHHWQILWLSELQDQLTPGVIWSSLEEGFEAFFESHARAAAARSAGHANESLLEAADRWRALELLLIRVQNVFYPYERGGPRQSNWIGSVIGGLTDDASDWVIEQVNSLDYDQLAADCGTDAEELAGRFERLAEQGRWIDPNAGVFDLIDQINRHSLERLKGSPRLARDFYDAARVLRSWHRRLKGAVPLPDLSEGRGLRRGVAASDRDDGGEVRGNRALLPGMLESYGLYPWRVQLIVEGDSEIVALRTIIEEGYHLSFEMLGIAAADLRGADIPSNAELLLAAFRAYANYYFLVFDNEGRAKEMINALVQANVIEGIGEKRRAEIREEGLKAARQVSDLEARREAMKEAAARANDLSQEPGDSPEFLLWRENFEVDNFSTAELCEVVVEFATEIGLDGFSLTPEDLDAKVAERREAGSEKGVASILLDMASDRDTGFRLSKPEFAQRLARWVLRDHAENGKSRPILDLAEQLVSLTWADRRLAGELRD